MNRVRANIWKIYIFKFLSEFYLIAPVLIPYYMAHGLNSTQVFIIQAGYAAAVLLLEIPSGYLADVIGRKRTLLLGAALFPIGIAVYALTSSFPAYLAAEFILAGSGSMRSGSDSALVYDSLLQLGRAEEYKKFEGRTFFYTRIGTSLSSVLGGVAALLTLHAPFFINIVTASAMIPMAVSLTEPERRRLRAGNPIRDILRICRFSLSNPKLRHLILYAALIGSTGITGIWAYFLYYESLGISIGFFGVLFAAFQLSSALGSRQAHLLEKMLGARVSFAAVLLVGPVFLALGLARTSLLIPVILLNAFFWGFSFPIIMDAVNRLISSEIRATVLSVVNMGVSLSFAILAPLFGSLADRFSLSSAFLALGGWVLAYGGLALIPLFRDMASSRSGTNGGCIPDPPHVKSRRDA